MVGDPRGSWRTAGEARTGGRSGNGGRWTGGGSERAARLRRRARNRGRSPRVGRGHPVAHGAVRGGGPRRPQEAVRPACPTGGAGPVARALQPAHLRVRRPGDGWSSPSPPSARHHLTLRAFFPRASRVPQNGNFYIASWSWSATFKGTRTIHGCRSFHPGSNCLVSARDVAEDPRTRLGSFVGHRNCPLGGPVR